MKIIISSAVTSEEKKAVKEKLYEMASNNLIKIEDKIYDCADTPCFLEKKQSKWKSMKPFRRQTGLYVW